ncbi:MAG: chromosome segregation protein SMC [Bacteroidia bacterium]
MRLTEIEVKGFKSFGDRVLVRFKEGVTGIVGPNGSGKSNVVDAIRWVLGEQKSRMLRSDKMEGVIFNGTNNRKQAALAEVRLTFDNHKGILPSEYREVTIGRRLYRSGESEYLLNGVTCRLKDITNLFLDTGIGSDSYAIIELKMIDEILNDKDHSRRDLFEEATGVSKYKIRKKETMARLEDAEADLSRVEDILFEIDRSMKQLQNQARKAEQVQQLKEDYRVAAMELAWHQLQGWQNQWQEGTVQEGDLGLEKSRLDQDLQDTEAKLSAGKSRMSHAEQNLSSARSVLQEINNRLRSLESQQQLQQERLRHLLDKIQSLEQQQTNDRDQQEEQKTRLEDLQNQWTACAQHLDEASAAVAEVALRLQEADHRMQEQDKAFQESRQHQDQRQAQRYALESNAHVLEAQVKALDAEKERLQTETLNRQDEFSQLETLVTSLAEEVKAMESGVQELEAFQVDHQQKVQACQQELQSLRPAVAEAVRHLDRKSNEAQLLGELVQNMEGYPESLRYLRDHQDWARSAPLLGDILQVEDRYRPMIERVLEPYLSYYVVKTYEEARSGIRLLTDAGMGKASFFVMEAFIGVSKTSGTRLQPPQGTLAALGLVEVPADFNVLVEHLLGNVYLQTEETNEWSFAQWKDQHPGTLLVTANGNTFGDGRWLSGGSMGLFEGKKLGRKRNLETLLEEIEKDKEALNALQQRLQVLQDTEVALRTSSRENQLNNSRSALLRKSSEAAQVQARHEQMLRALDQSSDRNKVIEEQKEGMLSEWAALQPQVEAILSELQEGNQNLVAMQEEWSVRKAVYQSVREEYTAITKQELHWVNQKANIETQMDFRRSQMELLQNRLEQAGRAVLELQEEHTRLALELEQSDDRRPALVLEEAAAQEALNQAEADFFGARGEQDSLEEHVRQLHRQREMNDQLLNQRKQQVLTVQMEIKALRERWALEFDQDPDILEQMEAPERGEHELAGLVQSMRKKIENFGPVNPMALEAYAEVEQRHVFITAQKADLVQARESLLQTIEEIDLKATERFLEGFSTIREHFIEVFRSLFTAEDDCDLILSHPEMPLDSAIQIMAKPKGKKPQSVNQLSGGEKTLTVTALLFAIYLYKPAPFCIFDEVDAPLDDVNIDKFNRMIRRFSKDSQFIIVTHNKRTMETTDLMYGVTMVEQGVSRVVPVDFSNLNEYVPADQAALTA